jgi:alcohol dehydrogenase
MKAAQINEYGDASVVRINEVDAPAVGEGKVLVEVHASSLNPFDTAVRSGYLKDMIPLQFPITLGGDIAGVITEVGPGVTNVSVGDKVYGQANIVAGNSGAMAEYAATDASQVAKAPENLDFNQAASVVLVGASALEGLNQHINLQPGQKIFISGGSGGIGTIAIQIAKHIGAYVATTASSDKADFLKQLGADEVIDYKTQDYTELLKDYNTVFDTVGGEEFSKSLTVLTRGGIAVSMAAQPDEAKASELGVKVIHQATKVTTEALDELRGLIESSIVTPQVNKVFPLDQIQQAFEARENGSITGKIAIQVK